MGKIVTIASVTLSWDRCAPFPFCTESALSKLIGMYILSTAYGAYAVRKSLGAEYVSLSVGS